MKRMILNGEGLPGIFKWDFYLFIYFFTDIKTSLGIWTLYFPLSLDCPLFPYTVQ